MSEVLTPEQIAAMQEAEALAAQQQAIRDAEVAEQVRLAAEAQARDASIEQEVQRRLQAHLRPPPARSPRDPSEDLRFGKLLNKPSEYDGKDRNQATTFLAQVQMYINGNTLLFPTEDSKVLFASTYLRGRAFSWFEPRMTKGVDPLLHDFTLFKTELLKAFGDPDREATMARKLKNLKQTGSASAYRTEFDNICQYLTWNDTALKSSFYDGLRPEVKDALAYVLDEPSKFSDYQDLVIRIDQRLYDRKVEARGGTSNKSNDNKKKTTGHNQSSNKSNSDKPTPKTDPGAMDLDGTNNRKFKPLTPAERQRRMENKLCLYCGEPGHRAQDCPKKKTRPGARLHATLTGPHSSDDSENSIVRN